MKNSKFKILTESLGFYSAKMIVLFLKQQIKSYESLSERPVDYWLKGRKNDSYVIPDNVIDIFLKLKVHQNNIISRINNGSLIYNFIYKNNENMWNNHPELIGLPTTFLNQIMIRLDIYNDYYENSSNID